MKKRRLILVLSSIFIVAICIIHAITPEKSIYSLNKLKDESDYTVIASREVSKCVETDFAYVMNVYTGKKPYIENGKFYTEMYLCCSCDDTLGDKITVVTNGYYFSKEDYCFLFLKCIDKGKNLYEPINDKTGIIKLKRKLKPMDKSLKKELDADFSKPMDFWDWFTAICEEKNRNIKEQTPETTQKSVAISTTAGVE